MTVYFHQLDVPDLFCYANIKLSIKVTMNFMTKVMSNIFENFICFDFRKLFMFLSN